MAVTRWPSGLGRAGSGRRRPSLAQVRNSASMMSARSTWSQRAAKSVLMGPRSMPRAWVYCKSLEAGVTPASYRTLKRRLPAYAKEAWRQGLSEACAAHARLGQPRALRRVLEGRPSAPPPPSRGNRPGRERIPRPGGRDRAGRSAPSAVSTANTTEITRTPSHRPEGCAGRCRASPCTALPARRMVCGCDGAWPLTGLRRGCPGRVRPAVVVAVAGRAG
jgi:hypothetical protein